MPPTVEEVRSQLDRMLASEVLASSTRLRRFLRYIVERALAGEGDQLKEYAIGVDVFDRGEQYDPRIDSIVRVEAGRLRTKVAEYYSRAGADDAVVIGIPRGSYLPVFERGRSTPPPVEATSTGAATPPGRRVPWHPALAVLAAAMLLLGIAAWWTHVEPTHRPGRPTFRGGKSPTPAVTVAVLPFAQYSTDEAEALLAARMTDGVTGELVRLGTVGVVSRTSTLQFSGQSSGARRSLREVAEALNADLVVEASMLTDGDRVRIQARLADPAINQKVWMHEFDGTRGDLDSLHRRIAEAITEATRRPLLR